MFLKILITVFIVFILSRLFRQRQNNKISLAALVFWFLLWLAVLVVFWQPESASYLANLLGIGRGADLIVYLSVVVIFYLLFRVFIRLNKIDSEITKLTRKDALKNVKDQR